MNWPAVIVVLLTVHLGIVVRHKHTQFPGPGRRDDNVVGGFDCVRGPAADRDLRPNGSHRAPISCRPH